MEDILPLNYYSEMCGVVVDIEIILSLIKMYFPSLKEILEDKEDNLGEYIGNNFINKGLNNLFTNDMLDEKTSLLIWDLLFLDGNIILIKAFISIYCCISKKIANATRDIENFQMIINKDVKEIKPYSYELIHGLILKVYEFSEENLENARFCLSMQVSNSLEDNTFDNMQNKINMDNKNIDINHETKYKACNKKWPYCINDSYFENVDQVIWYVVFSNKNQPKYIDNYFFDKIKEVKNKKYDNNNNDIYDILVERRMHFCEDEMNNENNIDSYKDEKDNETSEISNENYEKFIYDDIIKKPSWKRIASTVLDKLTPHKPFISDLSTNFNDENNIDNNITDNKNIILNNNINNINNKIECNNSIIDNSNNKDNKYIDNDVDDF